MYDELIIYDLQIDTSVHNQKVNYIRLNMGPDGGIARLKTYGVVKPDVASIPRKYSRSCFGEYIRYCMNSFVVKWQ